MLSTRRNRNRRNTNAVSRLAAATTATCIILVLLLGALSGTVEAAAACQACLFSIPLASRSQTPQHYVGSTGPRLLPIVPAATSIGGVRATILSALLPFAAVAGQHFSVPRSQHKYNRSRHYRSWLFLAASDDSNSADIEDKDKIQAVGKRQSSDDESSASGKVNVEESPILSSAAIGALRFYKGFISPLLPPACRFVPTCSQYGVQAIQEFGTMQGCILIAWRLLRCSPLGGKGYDPPKWPPVPYTYSSY
jgi:uncharacterized protein